MRRDGPAGTPVILITILLAGWLEVMPWPEGIAVLRPQWLVLVMIYWAIALPQRIGVVWGAGAGLFLDVLRGVTLGQHALALTLVVYIGQAIHKRLRVFPPLHQSAVIFMLVGLAVLVAYQIQGLAGRAQLPPAHMLAGALSSAILWRPAYLALRWTRQTFLVR